MGGVDFFKLVEMSNDLVDGLFLLKSAKNDDDEVLLLNLRQVAQELNKDLEDFKEAVLKKREAIG